MGNCCVACCVLCFKNTFYSINLSESITEKMNSKLRGIIMKGVKGGISSWYINLDRSIFSQYRHSLSTRLCKVIESLSLPVLNANGNLIVHLAENISQVLVRGLFDSEYFSTLDVYECLDIPISSLFFKCPDVVPDTNVVTNFKDYLSNIMDNDESEDFRIVNVGLDTEDKAYHQVFDKRLEVKLLESLHNLSDDKLSKLVSSVYSRFNRLETREKRVLSDNSRNFSNI